MLYALAIILDSRCGVDETESLMTTMTENLGINMLLIVTDARKMLEKLFGLYEANTTQVKKNMELRRQLAVRGLKAHHGVS